MGENTVTEVVVVVDYVDIVADPTYSTSEIASLLAKAFGSGSLGILAIRNVPHFSDAKAAFLPLAHRLAHLPQPYLEANLTDSKSLYNAGWSHGKEKLGTKPDVAKGSFYFNPLTDKPGTAEDRTKYPASYPCNVWPGDDVIPGFEVAAKNLGRIMHEVVVKLSRHIDAYASSKSGGTYPPNLLHGAMKETDKAKGRLLYYFPLSPRDDVMTQEAEPGREDEEQQQESEDSWIGWHNDSGFLTALAGDLYVDDDTGKPLAEGAPPDPNAGLYVTNRRGQSVKVDIPFDCMAVQLGECVQILTGGAVVATPHCVRGAKSRSGGTRVARISFPCFIDTAPSFPLTMPRGCDRAEVLSAGVENGKVPPLGRRWMEDGMAFGDFLQKTFETYYDWSLIDDEDGTARPDS